MSGWAVVVPVKSWQVAKSRLTGMHARARKELARAFAHDTVRTVCDTPVVDACFVVAPAAELWDLARALSDRGLCPVLEPVVRDGRDTLNAALVCGSDIALDSGHRRVAMVVADLPGLSTEGLTGFLRMVPAERPAFIRDVHGTGTTVLASHRGALLRPRFGHDSAVHHRRSGAVDLTSRCDPRLSHDVDTWLDLGAASRVAGPRVSRWFEGSRSMLATLSRSRTGRFAEAGDTRGREIG
ncbi:2-phospho-L-lactate guanylyltransferase [Haloechinothrix sp. YIM 98757]|uniref:2-phospho-L-lactate guanylyltransferase n=1 Tax=Haloechinothrix aidingensis TaxID=2752311 RepID=A0A838ADE2_9PSEU|nr:2-phospho-L-lactate guanylyltransferase [Haloechinothrix aidingensis]